MKTRNLIGKVNQLTIFGQVEFINNNEYVVSESGGVVTVTGDFKVVDSDQIERLQIQITTKQYIKHSKV